MVLSHTHEHAHDLCVVRIRCDTVRTVYTLLDGGLGVFGVFDGHCGKEVAIFVQNHYLALLQVRLRWAILRV